MSQVHIQPQTTPNTLLLSSLEVSSGPLGNWMPIWPHFWFFPPHLFSFLHLFTKHLQAPVLCQALCWKLGLNRNKATSLPKASQTNQSLKCCVMCHRKLMQAALRRATEPKQGQRRHPKRQAKVGWVMRAGGLPGKGAASRMAKGKQDHDPVVLILAGINYWCANHHTGLLSQNLCR